MSAASNLGWLGIGAIGLFLVAPSVPKAAPQAALDEPAPEAFAAKPSPPAGNGSATREIDRAGDGHFYVDAQVNGAHVRFLVDTGSSIVALTPADAQRAGIALPSERATARGAGGDVEVIPIEIERMALGPIEARDVRGAVADKLEVSLLGQSFLDRLAAVEISGDRMVLR